MKINLKKTILVILSAAVMIGLSAPQRIYAASDKSNIKKLVRMMDNAEVSVLTYEGAPYADPVKIKLTEDKMARFAALSLPTDDSDGLMKGEFDLFVTYRISDSALKAASKKMFGREYSKREIITKENDSWVCDVIWDPDEGAVRYVTDGEAESDYAVRKISVKNTKEDTYKVTKSIYYGYWGGNDGKTVNYKIIYTVQKCGCSSLGFRITGIKIKPVYES